MDSYKLDTTPMYVHPRTAVAVYKGISLIRNRLPVVVKRHHFTQVQKKNTQVHIAQVISMALTQAKAHPITCEGLKVQMEIDSVKSSMCGKLWMGM